MLFICPPLLLAPWDFLSAPWSFLLAPWGFLFAPRWHNKCEKRRAITPGVRDYSRNLGLHARCYLFVPPSFLQPGTSFQHHEAPVWHPGGSFSHLQQMLKKAGDYSRTAGLQQESRITLMPDSTYCHPRLFAPWEYFFAPSPLLWHPGGYF